MINIPIQRSIVADSRDHDHSVGSELPHLSIKQENLLNLKKMTNSQRVRFSYYFGFSLLGLHSYRENLVQEK